jgi:hypothetical protein
MHKLDNALKGVNIRLQTNFGRTKAAQSPKIDSVERQPCPGQKGVFGDCFVPVLALDGNWIRSTVRRQAAGRFTELPKSANSS